jgi:hypothetical protein
MAVVLYVHMISAPASKEWQRETERIRFVPQTLIIGYVF